MEADRDRRRRGWRYVTGGRVGVEGCFLRELGRQRDWGKRGKSNIDNTILDDVQQQYEKIYEQLVDISKLKTTITL